MAGGKTASQVARLVGPATRKRKMPAYTVTLAKTADRWRAWCQALPECHGEGKNQKQAYMAIKKSIRQRIKKRLQEGKPVSIDKTTTKFFRVDLEALRGTIELR